MNGPIILIMNSRSGSHDKNEARDKIMSRLQDSGRPVELIELEEGDDCNTRCDKKIEQAKETQGLIAVAGGDGTVNAVAALCQRHSMPMAVIPMGTFNYFARDLNIPPNIDQAIDILLNGIIKTVSVGFIHERIFLNNASFGLYTKIIRNREQDKSRFGRLRMVAACSAVMTLFKGQRQFSIKMSIDGKEELRRTSLVFVGNNTLQLDNLGMDVAACTQQNKLAIVVMKHVTRWKVAHLLLQGVLKKLKDESKLETFCAEQFEVTSRRTSIELVVDGEIIQCRMPLDFRIEKNALKIIVPPGEPVKE